MPAQSTNEFISRWSQASGAERANYQLFLTELCETLNLPRPEPASHDTAENAYVFERKVVFPHADGTQSLGYIDLYKRGCFVLEAKQTGKELGSGVWGNAMLRAHGQAQQYARALPAAEGRPPFLIVTDVGRTIELYSEFTRSGAAYVPFPDPRSHRIPLEDLAREDHQQTLRAVWTDPLNLDPARRSARVTKAIAADLAILAEGLEHSGYDADSVASFLMRCLFTMFAEDVELLPKRSFLGLLEESMNDPAMFAHLVPGLWKTMNQGGFSPEIRNEVLRFNGGLFAEQRALPLTKGQIALLLAAAQADWRDVEPAIFGTLLERALDPLERHKLGAHYTPRAYVERLVMPTVIEPLREEWTAVQAAAVTLERQGKTDAAVSEVIEFQKRLSSVRVLDPACGSGNFLYVTLEHLKRLEGEVFNTLDDLGHPQTRFETAGLSVDPHQMLGLESNPRAARIAEAVLWIGYLQWHFRTRGNVNPPEPVLKDYHNIECRDAVLAWDRVEYVTDEQGKPVTRWDGRTTKPHPVTGEEVPDENAQVVEERYIKPRKAVWPKADFVVGNPPFIGNKKMRGELGSGYVEALRSTYPTVPGSADYVMYWWHQAAMIARERRIDRFGFITTNSVHQSFNRKVLQHHLEAKDPLSLIYAIPDHPWVDSTEGADVRIAMTVGQAGDHRGVLNSVITEQAGQDEGAFVQLATAVGKLYSNLQVGADVGGAIPLRANDGLCWQGCKLVGKHFQISPEVHDRFVGSCPASAPLLKRYWAGGDITQTPNRRYVIDTFGLSLDELIRKYPALYQHLIDYVHPERAQNRDRTFREKWWLFGRPRPEMRAANQSIPKYIVTSEVSKHRVFMFLSWPEDLIDGSITSVSLADAYYLGILSSRSHIAWALRAGGRMGIGNDPRYQNGPCFDPFPFPDATDAQKSRIRDLAEQLDAHRKRQQQLHPGLTMTGMYNVLEQLRRGEPLSAKEREIHEQGLVAVLAQLHDELDAAVLEAYNWQDLAPAIVGKPGGTTPYSHKSPEQSEAEETLLTRLVVLNAERAAQEARGIVRWLRPEFQDPQGRKGAQETLIEGIAPEDQAAPIQGKRPWPKALSEQVRAVRAALAEQPGPATAAQVAKVFKGAQTKRITGLLQTLDALGQARVTEDGRFASV